ncbi:MULTISPECIES: hypothetical protein [Amycolatopsis]|uniref:Uncharacterized protein n=1 Tax=Amycolatopsis bullii TaxID=941987 RepID=A0ABQ3KAF1_9PSEU|nr:hypothetical protein [Amycolatopsis bullii]GHG10994.1 hypothetical protein GCM10017567_30250 [Amycolatopsis bullii]
MFQPAFSLTTAAADRLTAGLGSAEPWSFGLIGVGPAVAGYFADDLRRRVRGG